MADEGSGNREANVKETVRFWRAWKTVHQLCKDRVCDAIYPFSVLHFSVQMLSVVSEPPAQTRMGTCDDTILIAMGGL